MPLVFLLEGLFWNFAFISAAFRWNVIWVSFGAWVHIGRVSLKRSCSFLLALVFISAELHWRSTAFRLEHAFISVEFCCNAATVSSWAWVHISRMHVSKLFRCLPELEFIRVGLRCKVLYCLCTYFIQRHCIGSPPSKFHTLVTQSVTVLDRGSIGAKFTCLTL